MSTIGERVAGLRAANRETLREAADRTGVSHTTIARIEKGEVTGSFHGTIAKIARGYGVSPEYLFTGRDPKRQFEDRVRLMNLDERCLLLYSPQRRVKLVLDFLAAEYPAEVPVPRIAAAAAVPAEELAELLLTWDETEPDQSLSDRVGAALVRVTGISRAWFEWGGLDVEGPSSVLRTVLSEFAGAMAKEARAAVSPHQLSRALDHLISDR